MRTGNDRIGREPIRVGREGTAAAGNRTVRGHVGAVRTGVMLAILAVLFPIISAGTGWAQLAIDISFENSPVGSFPSGWSARTNQAKEIYLIYNENGKKFLRADAKGVADQIGYQKKWVLKEFPILEWQWRPLLFPNNSDERKQTGNDSVLGLYVVFGRWPFLKSIKYIWSENLDAETSFPSPFAKDTKILVVRSGRTLAGQWVTESRNVLSDYRRLFGDREAAPVAEGIAILTDSDNTGSRATGDYGPIRTLPPNGEPYAWP